MTQYLIIAATDDGVGIDHLSKEDLLERIADNYYGNNIEFLDRFTGFDDLYRNQAVVFQAKIVVPRPVEVITKFEV